MLTLERSAHIRELIANSSGELAEAAHELLKAYDIKFMQSISNKEQALKQARQIGRYETKLKLLQQEVVLIKSVNVSLKEQIEEAFIAAELAG